jgi:hypothetical protein
VLHCTTRATATQYQSVKIGVSTWLYSLHLNVLHADPKIAAPQHQTHETVSETTIMAG